MKPILLVALMCTFFTQLNAQQAEMDSINRIVDNLSGPYLSVHYNALKTHLQYVEKTYCPRGICDVNVCTAVEGLPTRIGNLRIHYIDSPRPGRNKSMYVIDMETETTVHDTIIVRIIDRLVRNISKVPLIRGKTWWSNSGGTTIKFIYSSASNTYAIADIQQGWL